MAKTKLEAKKKKGAGGFGPVSRAAIGGVGEPARLTAQERATKEMRRYQKDGRI